MLAALGIPDEDEQLYRVLLHRPRRTLPELAAQTGRGATSVRRALYRLEDLGLVSRLLERPTRFVATRPDVAVETLIARRQEELAGARAAAHLLLAELPAEHRYDQAEQVEMVFGRAAVTTRFLQLQQLARDELLVLDRPPYAQDATEPNTGEMEMLRRGTRCRGIYAPESLESPGALRLIRQMMSAGEQARVHPRVPMKLAIADRSIAILPVSFEEVAETALVVRTSTLLDALVTLFELLWRLALPVPADADGTAGDLAAPAEAGMAGQADLLALLAAGAKDETLARQLGVSLRTVHRRTRDLMDLLGARTRFQAGVLAAQRGLTQGRLS